MKPLGDAKPSAEALAQMRERGGEWYAYQNVDLGSRGLGDLQFLKCGEGCTYVEPPKRLPDTQAAINWRFWLTGKVDLEAGDIRELLETKGGNDERSR